MWTSQFVVWWYSCCWCCFLMAILHIVVEECGKKPSRIANELANWRAKSEGAAYALYTRWHGVIPNYCLLLCAIERQFSLKLFSRPNQPTNRPNDQHITLCNGLYTVCALTLTQTAFLGFKTQILPLPWEINKCDKALYSCQLLISFLSRVYHKRNNRQNTSKHQKWTFFPETVQPNILYIYSCVYAWKKSAPCKRARHIILATTYYNCVIVSV